MTDSPPVVYLLHGEDDFSIAQSIAEIEAKLGDSPTASMNSVRLDGRSASMEALRLSAYAAPFLAPRRIVIFDHPLARINSQPLKEKLLSLLDGVPGTTALVLVEYRSLEEKGYQSKPKKDHWLLSWAKAAGPRVFIKSFTPKSEEMPKWIQDQAKANGGKFTPEAAGLLASRVGDDTRTAYQEILKLLAYGNYRHAVQPEDVDLLTAGEGKLEDFALPNALRARDGRKALKVLHRLLEEDDPIPILQGIVYQVRVLLLARDVLDRGGRVDEVVSELTRYPNLKIKSYPARLAAEQARRMDRIELERIYRQLLRIDEAIKTGQMDGSVALESFVAGFTNP
jgi:DNA polymerase-3 subunit delta